ncbi:hypothetical protein C2G38_2157254 [Gigaspora rosea]|uniref:Uncharacterized protein n=1 Tax=Gigaspora rosea TaxID=44941 RepID=A0A397W3M4_9GLOM|nr:hypothetical protein C2G38_2157254 [Gigaspora rosea]
MRFTNSKKKENVMSDTLPIEENLPTEQEVVQLELLQLHDAENIDNTQGPWEIFEETVVDSGQALGYNPDDGLSDKWELDSDEESFYPVISKEYLMFSMFSRTFKKI